MSALAFRIRYVDGVETTAPLERWRDVRADGVDWFEVTTRTGTTRWKGHSLYWLRRDGDDWIAGAASFYPNARGELTIHPDGSEEARPIGETVPDLKHHEVKLGWWAEGRPRG